MLSRGIQAATSTLRVPLSIWNSFKMTSLSSSRKMNNGVQRIPKVVFILGGPGAGKGTQCSKIVEKYGFVHLSAGDLLRAERSKVGSKVGDLIDKHIREGTIVPVKITCTLIHEAMVESASDFFLIDGFPRSKGNLEGWIEDMTDKARVVFVLLFEVYKETCVERCLSRGEAGSGRTDDNLTSLQKRISTYENETVPVIDYFGSVGLLRTVDASKSPDVVFEDVQQLFDNVLMEDVSGSESHVRLDTSFMKP